MKKLLRILPYLTMVWVAMYVNKSDGEITWKSDDHGKYWTTKKQCMKAAQRIGTSNYGDYYSFPDRGTRKTGTAYTSSSKPVCYRLTKYSTR